MPPRGRVVLLAGLVALLFLGWSGATQGEDAPPLEREIAPEDWLVASDLPSGGGREAMGDAILLSLLTNTFSAPREGDPYPTYHHPDARAAWRKIRAEGGRFTQGPTGRFFAYTCVEVDSPRRALVVAEGIGRVFLDGQMTPGDVYSASYAQFPVQLRPGRNHVVILAIPRGGIAFRLVPPRAPVQLNLRDVTAPDAVQGRPLEAFAGVPVVNTLARTVTGARIAVGDDLRFRRTEVSLPPLAPGQVLKWPVRLVGVEAFAPDTPRELEVPIEVHAEGGKDEGRLKVRVQPPGHAFKRTFRSEIDESVQYAGVVEPADPTPGERPGIVLTLHGAGVEGIGQAAAYSAKPSTVIVAPTNRRPFGFDWEDWGMLDAIETLDRALEWYGADPERVMLTGHSMGGHGTWAVGLLHAHRFAAIGPSAGWASFALYGAGGGGGAVFASPVLQDVLLRCRHHSELLGFLPNAREYGVYILHGKDDDNVPVSQARMMKYFLERDHADLAYHEEPGAGHWWDKDTARPGADCVDWPPLFDFFARRARKPVVEDGAWVTPTPTVASRYRFLEVLAQESAHADSRLEVRTDLEARTIGVRTANVAALAIDRAGGLPAGWRLVLDGVPAADGALGLGRAVAVREGAAWRFGPDAAWTGKRPRFGGPLKDAFQRPFVFVIGSAGSEEETAAARSVAVYLANVWWWRGNGTVRVIADQDVTPDLIASYNLVLFGNRESNLVLARADLPVRVARGRVDIGAWTRTGGGLATAFVHPAPGALGRLWCVYGGTDAAGIRLAGFGEVFRSGHGLPDFIVWDGEAVLRGFGAARAAGFFDAQWRLPGGPCWFE